MKASQTTAVCAVLLLLLVAESQLSMAANCVASELAPCADAISASSAPSKECCAKITEQKSCLCTYIKDPKLKNFVTAANAKKIASTCGVPIPKC